MHGFYASENVILNMWRIVIRIQKEQATIVQANKHLSGADLQFLVDSILSLIRILKMLKWSYVQRYYLKSETKRNLIGLFQEKIEKQSSEWAKCLELAFTDIWLYKRGFRESKSLIVSSELQSEKVNFEKNLF
jgi:hypothetical protein